MHRKTKLIITVIVALIVFIGGFWGILAYHQFSNSQADKKMEFINTTRNIELELYAVNQNDSVSNGVAESTDNMDNTLEQTEMNHSENNQMLALFQYLRSGRDSYMTEEWNLLCGSLDTSVVEAIDSKDIKESFAALRHSDTIQDPLEDKKLDFIHMCASLNVAVGSFKTMEDGKLLVQEAGWIGDLLQVVSASEDSSLIGTDDGSLNTADLIADIDAANLLQMITEQSNNKFYISLESYYEDKDINRYQKFIDTYYPQVQSAEELAQEMQANVMNENSVVLQALCQSLNVNRAEKTGQIKEVCTKLASIVFENK